MKRATRFSTERDFVTAFAECAEPCGIAAAQRLPRRRRTRNMGAASSDGGLGPFPRGGGRKASWFGANHSVNGKR